jgi:autotransporter-associated beta strand protein
VIGDGTGTDEVRLNTDNQIPNTSSVTVTGNIGLLNLNNHLETTGALILNGGTVSTGTGKLTLAGNVTVNGPATVNGNLSLGTATRTVTVADGIVLQVFAAVSSDALGAGLTKAGPGTMTYLGSAANAIFGATTVNDGTLRLLRTPGTSVVEAKLVIGDGVRTDQVVVAANNQIDDSITVDINSSGVLQLDNTLETIGLLTLTWGSVTTGTGALTLAGNVVSNAAATAATITGNVSLGAATRTFTVADGNPAQDLIVSAVLSGTGGLTKGGPGTLGLSAANTYPGTTTVTAGTLLVNGAQPGSPVSVTAGILGGTGRVGPITTTGGTVNPGSAGAGILNTTGNVAFNTTTTFAADLNGTTAGFGFDQLNVAGTVNLARSTLSAGLNFKSAVGNSFVIINNDGTDPIVETFAGLAQGGIFTTPSGVQLQVNYAGGTGNDLVLTQINTPPAFKNRSVTSPVKEGELVTFTGTTTEPDPLDTFFLEVTWGDGSPTETSTFAPGSNGTTVQVTHRYLDNNPGSSPKDTYTLHSFWHDQHGDGNSADLLVKVKNVAPKLSDLSASTQGNVVTVTGTIIDPGLQDTFTLEVNWGHGVRITYTFPAGATSFSVSNEFQGHLPHEVLLTLQDDDEGVVRTHVQAKAPKSHKGASNPAGENVDSSVLQAIDEVFARKLWSGGSGSLR